MSDYRFEVISVGDERYLKAYLKSSSIYENFTTEIKNHEIFQGGMMKPPSLIGSPLMDDTGFTRIAIEAIEGDIQLLLDLDRNGIRIFAATQNRQQQFRRTVTFPPGARAKVTMEEIGYFDLIDFEEWSHLAPSLNLEVTATFEGANFLLEGEPDESLKGFYDSSVDPAANIGKWIINGAMLPGQGIRFWWEPADEEAEIQAQISSSA